MFDGRPELNVGTRTGDGIFAVDVDPRHDGPTSFRKFVGRHSLPQTAEALTGGGGKHYLFRVDDAHRIRCRNGLLPGIDIKGDGGYIVVEPSTHPDTGREYVWTRHPRQGIADAPGWLLRTLADEGLPIGRDEPREAPEPPVRLFEADDPDGLIAQMVERFPVVVVGSRDTVMCRVLNSLVGRRYDLDTVVSVASAWWRHYYDMGTIRTPPPEAEETIRRNLPGLLERYERGDYRYTATAEDHLEACRAMELEPWQTTLLEGRVCDLLPREDSEESPERGPRPRIREASHPPLRCALCQSDNDRVFVESMLRLTIHELSRGADGLVRATNDQIQTLARSLGRDIGHRQTFERLKARFVTRAYDGKPAKRFELLLALEEGHRDLKRPSEPGTPTVYRPTGILAMLAPLAQ